MRCQKAGRGRFPRGNRCLCLPAGQKIPYGGMPAFFQQLFRIAAREHRPGIRVNENGIVADRKYACQFVGHDDDRGPQAVAQFEDQIVEQMRADRVEPRGRLVEKEDVGIEGHGTRKAGPLFHAAADLRGVILLEAREADECKLQGSEFPDLRGLNFVYSSRVTAIFSARVMELHSAPLW